MKRPGLTFLVLLLAAGSAGADGTNVLLLVADDLNVALGTYGHPTAVTPHIDALAERGVRFDRAYVQYPLCNPSRTSFLSGLRPDTTGVYTGSAEPRARIGDAIMLPEHFTAHGYFTARVGKLAHDRFPNMAAWEVSEQAPGDPYYMPGTDHSEVRDNTWIEGAADGMTRLEILAHLGRSSGLPLVWRATDTTAAQEPDGGTARRIVELLEDRARDERPFLIAAGFHKPHQPWIAPREYFARHPIERVGLPAQVVDDRADMPAAAYVLRPDDAEHTPDQIRQARAAYHATVTLVDDQVGLIMAALDRLDLARNTVVVFVSDHGFHLGEHGGLWRKTTLFEEATRIPFIVAAPGRLTGVASKALVELVDLYPTLAELAGLPVPAGLEGTSMAPLLLNPDRPWKTAAFSEVVRGEVHGRSIRTARYRYTEWRGDESVADELYDLAADPAEFVNLAGDAGQAERMRKLGEMLAAGWRGALPPGSDPGRSALTTSDR